MDSNNTFNILLLGETGVGKSTFVNSCANYIKYGTFEEAQKDPTILIDVFFNITNSDFKSRKVVLPASSLDNSPNEQHHTVGESATQSPVIHTIVFHHDGVRKRIQFIDTPGVNDTRGWEQDERNFKKVLEVVRSVGELHAICILLKPNESTLTLGFRNALDHFLIKLHSSSTKNIVFCFTNTRSTLYRPGETLPVLETYLHGIERSSGIRITPDTSNVFCFDNDCFRYLCTLLHGEERNERLHGMLTSGWGKNLTELKRLLKRVQCLVPHLVQDTIAINSVQNAFNSRAKVLVEQAVDLLLPKETLEARIKELERFRAAEVCAFKKMEAMTMVYDERRIGCLRLVCTSSKCAKAIRLIDGTSAMMPRLCHDDCQVRKERHDTTHLQKCAVFTLNENTETSKSKIRGRISKCRCCDCPWTTHEHANTEYFPVQRKSDQDSADANRINQELDKNLAELKRCQIELIKTQDRIQTIDTAVSEASAYLSVHTIKKGTDPFLYYLDRQLDIEVTSLTYIKQLIQKHEKITENSKLKVIQAVRQRYLGRVDSITSAIRRKERTTMSAEDLLRMMRAGLHILQWPNVEQFQMQKDTTEKYLNSEEIFKEYHYTLKQGDMQKSFHFFDTPQIIDNFEIAQNVSNVSNLEPVCIKPEETFESTISRNRQGASRSHRDRLTNIASFSARSDPFNRTTAVDIGKGWMGKLRADLY